MHKPTVHVAPTETADWRSTASGVPEAASSRESGYVFALVFAGVGCWPWLHGGTPRYWAWAVAVLLFATARVSPNLLVWPDRLWRQIGNGLHRITNPLIHFLIFFLAVVPTGMLMRAFGKDPLRLRFERNSSSYWIVRNPPGPSPATMKHPF